MREKLRRTLNSDAVFDVVVNVIGGIIVLIVLIPLIFVLAASFSDPDLVIRGKVLLLPKGFTTKAYVMVFENEDIWRGFINSCFYTAAGTAISVVLTILAAYPLSRKNFAGRGIFMMLILFTMLFSGGLVPGYLNVKNLGLINSIWSMILPTAVSTYYMIIMKNYFVSLPESLEEAARIDGANSFVILAKIIIPISMPFVATFVLFYAVERWNEWYNAMLYTNKKDLQPLQIYLREVLISLSSQLASQAQVMMGKTQKVLASTVQMACIVVTMVPILCVYPFVQKHFVKGVMVGGIKE